MKIELQNIKVSDLVDGYADNQEPAAVGKGVPDFAEGEALPQRRDMCVLCSLMNVPH